MVFTSCALAIPVTQACLGLLDLYCIDSVSTVPCACCETAELLIKLPNLKQALQIIVSDTLRA